MKKYYYCVNTFENGMPVQITDTIFAESEEEVVRMLIEDGIIDPSAYEFLELDTY